MGYVDQHSYIHVFKCFVNLYLAIRTIQYDHHYSSIKDKIVVHIPYIYM